ncbi:hypothetical protein OIU84_018208 [Salix udensis]|uniref:Uncharacterized protein n=1 Tax=Salix udensis TaxID=889485 RepID=A0AAD6L3K0_9ROSI|nr:hypothetical protein OIU84_018208 [Salix udensis]
MILEWGFERDLAVTLINVWKSNVIGVIIHQLRCYTLSCSVGAILGLLCQHRSPVDQIPSDCKFLLPVCNWNIGMVSLEVINPSDNNLATLFRRWISVEPPD